MSDWHTAGWFLVRPSARGNFSDASLVPERALTVSACLAEMVPHTWCIEWTGEAEATRAEAAAALNLDDAGRAALTRWATDALEREYGWPSVFYSADAALEVRRRFFPRLHDLCVVGVALWLPDRAAFLEEHTPTGENMGVPGVLQCIARDLRPEPDERVVGYDVLGYDYGAFHSYLCNGLETLFATRLGARPNAIGLYDDPGVARACAAVASEAEVGAEPADWRAARITLAGPRP